MELDHTQAPTTVKEIGIHVGYLREDITEIKQMVKDGGLNYATRTEVDDHETRLRLLERSKDEIEGAQSNTKKFGSWILIALTLGEVIIYWLQLNKR